MAGSGTVEGAVTMTATAAVLGGWTGLGGPWLVQVGAQLLLFAVGIGSSRVWLARGEQHPTTGDETAGGPSQATVTSALLVFVLPMLFAMVVAIHFGRSGRLVFWNTAGPPTSSLYGHLWVPILAVELVLLGTLLQRVVESQTRHWRPVLAALASVLGAVSLAHAFMTSWFGSASPTVSTFLGAPGSGAGFFVGVAVGLSLGDARRSARHGPVRGRLARWAILPLSTVAERPARVVLGGWLWAWPAVFVFAVEAGRPTGWAAPTTAAVAVFLGAGVSAALERWFRATRLLPSSTRRGIGAAMLAGLAILGTSTVVAAADVAGVGDAGADPRTLLSLAVPELEIAVPRPISVFLVGDSTMAPMRWFRQGQASLRGFDYVLDAESCRKIAKHSCWGRESRIPTSAALAIESRRRNFDYVVLMAGAHSMLKDLDGELRLAQRAAEDHGAKLLVLTLRESTKYVDGGGSPGESAFTASNRVIRAFVDDLGSDKVGLIDWNRFSIGRDEWFRSDGIHPNLVGTVALGWFLSESIAADADNPCPYDWSYPCVVPTTGDQSRDWLADFGVTPSEVHCYEDGNERIKVCQRDRRM